MKSATILPLAGLVTGLVATSPLWAADSPNLDLARRLNEAFVHVVDQVSPAVVVITVTPKSTPPPAGAGDDGDSFDSLPPGDDPRFHHPFGGDVPELAQGSGVIIRKDGYILTNEHVVDNADRIEVRLHDGRTFPAKVRGLDAISDLAVIRIEASDLPVARLADSSKTRVGEFAVAVGAPFSYAYSVTFGHVSAKERSNVIPAFEGGWMMDQEFIQTDANINPGNSGGPLVNIEGDVIGINTVIRGLHTGIGFAIPSNLAREVSDRLIAEGKFPRAWLGIGIRSLKDDADLRAMIKGVTSGVIVQTILPDGPSAKSDLRPSDIILALDGQRVATAQELRSALRHKQIGQAVTLDVYREGRTNQVRVVPGEWLEARTAAPVPSPPEPQVETVAPSGLGITVHPLTRELAERFGASMVPGVIVVTVDRDSPAARKGIQPGDIITAIDQQPVASPEQFRQAIGKSDPKKGVIVVLLSGRTSRFEVLKEGAE